MMHLRVLTLSAILICARGFRAAQAKPELHAFQPVAQAAPDDWAVYSPDVSMLAVVHTELAEDDPPSGKSLDVYALDKSGRAERRLFQEKQPNRIITEVQWVGDCLLYATIDGFKTLKDYGIWLHSPHPPGVGHMLKHINTMLWVRAHSSHSTLTQIKSLPPGILLPGGTSRVFVMDPIDLVDDEKLLSTRHLRSYSIPNLKPLTSVAFDCPRPNYRWWGGPDKFVPMSMSSNSDRLIGIVSGAYRLRHSKGSIPLVISVATATGAISVVTPDNPMNCIEIASDPEYFLRGNPTLVHSEGADQIACNLTRTDAGAELAYRFGFFGLNGKLNREVLIFGSDLQRAGVPLGIPLTWSPDGQSVVVQSRKDVWTMNLSTQKGRLVCGGVLVTQVVSWLDPTRLLVRANPIVAGSTPSHELPAPVWGILTVPREVDADKLIAATKGGSLPGS